MKKLGFRGCLTSLLLLALSTANGKPALEWQMEEHKGYRLFHQETELSELSSFRNQISRGVKNVTEFMSSDYDSSFEVYLHPNRHSLDQTWQQDWSYPDFKSECWMVASGVATKMDLLSPACWAEEACEHDASDSEEILRLITHELVHVFHGQQNVSPDFSEYFGLDWFAEGLATYASGQCDQKRMEEVNTALGEGKAPATLDEFWTGRLRYGQSGSMVMYIDHRYGREKLKELFQYNQKSELLQALGISEEKLIEGWEVFIRAFLLTENSPNRAHNRQKNSWGTSLKAFENQQSCGTGRKRHNDSLVLSG